MNNIRPFGRKGTNISMNTTQKKALSAEERLALLFDEGSFTELFLSSKTSVIVGKGTVLGKTVYAFSHNTEKDNGAIGKGSYEKIKGLYDLAYKTGDPVVGIYDSFGAKITETEDSLRAMAEIYKKIGTLSGVIPQISLVLGTCVGSMALAALSADLVVATKDSDFRSRSVSYKAENEEDAIETVRSILDKLPSNNLTDGDIFEWTDKTFVIPNETKEYAGLLADEMSSTPLYEGEVIADLCTVRGVPALVLGFFGEIDKDKAAIYSRLVRLADAYSLPIITLVDKAQASVDVQISDLYKAFSVATTPKISVVLGEAFGSVLSGYVLSGSDFTVAVENAVISAAKPASAAYLLYSDEMEGESEDEALKKITEKYISEYASASKMCENGLISFVTEPKDLKGKISAYLDVLASKKETTLPKKHSI